MALVPKPDRVWVEGSPVAPLTDKAHVPETPLTIEEMTAEQREEANIQEVIQLRQEQGRYDGAYEDLTPEAQTREYASARFAATGKQYTEGLLASAEHGWDSSVAHLKRLAGNATGNEEWVEEANEIERKLKETPFVGSTGYADQVLESIAGSAPEIAVAATAAPIAAYLGAPAAVTTAAATLAGPILTGLTTAGESIKESGEGIGTDNPNVSWLTHSLISLEQAGLHLTSQLVTGGAGKGINKLFGAKMMQKSAPSLPGYTVAAHVSSNLGQTVLDMPLNYWSNYRHNISVLKMSEEQAHEAAVKAVELGAGANLVTAPMGIRDTYRDVKTEGINHKVKQATPEMMEMADHLTERLYDTNRENFTAEQIQARNELFEAVKLDKVEAVTKDLESRVSKGRSESLMGRFFQGDSEGQLTAAQSSLDYLDKLGIRKFDEMFSDEKAARRFATHIEQADPDSYQNYMQHLKQTGRLKDGEEDQMYLHLRPDNDEFMSIYDPETQQQVKEEWDRSVRAEKTEAMRMNARQDNFEQVFSQDPDARDALNISLLKMGADMGMTLDSESLGSTSLTSQIASDGTEDTGFSPKKAVLSVAKAITSGSPYSKSRQDNYRVLVGKTASLLQQLNYYNNPDEKLTKPQLQEITAMLTTGELPAGAKMVDPERVRFEDRATLAELYKVLDLAQLTKEAWQTKRKFDSKQIEEMLQSPSQYAKAFLATAASPVAILGAVVGAQAVKRWDASRNTKRLHSLKLGEGASRYIQDSYVKKATQAYLKGETDADKLLWEDLHQHYIARAEGISDLLFRTVGEYAKIEDIPAETLRQIEEDFVPTSIERLNVAMEKIQDLYDRLSQQLQDKRDKAPLTTDSSTVDTTLITMNKLQNQWDALNNKRDQVIDWESMLKGDRNISTYKKFWAEVKGDGGIEVRSKQLDDAKIPLSQRNNLRRELGEELLEIFEGPRAPTEDDPYARDTSKGFATVVLDKITKTVTKDKWGRENFTYYHNGNRLTESEYNKIVDLEKWMTTHAKRDHLNVTLTYPSNRAKMATGPATDDKGPPKNRPDAASASTAGAPPAPDSTPPPPPSGPAGGAGPRVTPGQHFQYGSRTVVVEDFTPDGKVRVRDINSAKEFWEPQVNDFLQDAIVVEKPEPAPETPLTPNRPTKPSSSDKADDEIEDMVLGEDGVYRVAGAEADEDPLVFPTAPDGEPDAVIPTPSDDLVESARQLRETLDTESAAFTQLVDAYATLLPNAPRESLVELAEQSIRSTMETTPDLTAEQAATQFAAALISQKPQQQQQPSVPPTTVTPPAQQQSQSSSETPQGSDLRSREDIALRGPESASEALYGSDPSNPTGPTTEALQRFSEALIKAQDTDGVLPAEAIAGMPPQAIAKVVEGLRGSLVEAGEGGMSDAQRDNTNRIIASLTQTAREITPETTGHFKTALTRTLLSRVPSANPDAAMEDIVNGWATYLEEAPIILDKEAATAALVNRMDRELDSSVEVLESTPELQKVANEFMEVLDTNVPRKQPSVEGVSIGTQLYNTDSGNVYTVRAVEGGDLVLEYEADGETVTRKVRDSASVLRAQKLVSEEEFNQAQQAKRDARAAKKPQQQQPKKEAEDKAAERELAASITKPKKQARLVEPTQPDELHKDTTEQQKNAFTVFDELNRRLQEFLRDRPTNGRKYRTVDETETAAIYTTSTDPARGTVARARHVSKGMKTIPQGINAAFTFVKDTLNTLRAGSQLEGPHSHPQFLTDKIRNLYNDLEKMEKGAGDQFLDALTEYNQDLPDAFKMETIGKEHRFVRDETGRRIGTIPDENTGFNLRNVFDKPAKDIRDATKTDTALRSATEDAELKMLIREQRGDMEAQARAGSGIMQHGSAPSVMTFRDNITYLKEHAPGFKYTSDMSQSAVAKLVEKVKKRQAALEDVAWIRDEYGEIVRKVVETDGAKSPEALKEAMALLAKYDDMDDDLLIRTLEEQADDKNNNFAEAVATLNETRDMDRYKDKAQRELEALEGLREAGMSDDELSRRDANRERLSEYADLLSRQEEFDSDRDLHETLVDEDQMDIVSLEEYLAEEGLDPDAIGDPFDSLTATDSASANPMEQRARAESAYDKLRDKVADVVEGKDTDELLRLEKELREATVNLSMNPDFNVHRSSVYAVPRRLPDETQAAWLERVGSQRVASLASKTANLHKQVMDLIEEAKDPNSGWRNTADFDQKRTPAKLSQKKIEKVTEMKNKALVKINEYLEGAIKRLNLDGWEGASQDTIRLWRDIEERIANNDLSATYLYDTMGLIGQAMLDTRSLKRVQAQPWSALKKDSEGSITALRGLILREMGVEADEVLREKLFRKVDNLNSETKLKQLYDAWYEKETTVNPQGRTVGPTDANVGKKHGYMKVAQTVWNYLNYYNQLKGGRRATFLPANDPKLAALYDGKKGLLKGVPVFNEIGVYTDKEMNTLIEYTKSLIPDTVTERFDKLVKQGTISADEAESIGKAIISNVKTSLENRMKNYEQKKADKKALTEQETHDYQQDKILRNNLGSKIQDLVARVQAGGADKDAAVKAIRKLLPSDRDTTRVTGRSASDDSVPKTKQGKKADFDSVVAQAYAEIKAATEKYPAGTAETADFIIRVREGDASVFSPETRAGFARINGADKQYFMGTDLEGWFNMFAENQILGRSREKGSTTQPVQRDTVRNYRNPEQTFMSDTGFGTYRFRTSEPIVRVDQATGRIISAEDPTAIDPRTGKPMLKPQHDEQGRKMVSDDDSENISVPYSSRDTLVIYDPAVGSDTVGDNPLREERYAEFNKKRIGALSDPTIDLVDERGQSVRSVPYKEGGDWWRGDKIERGSGVEQDPDQPRKPYADNADKGDWGYSMFGNRVTPDNLQLSRGVKLDGGIRNLRIKNKKDEAAMAQKQKPYRHTFTLQHNVQDGKGKASAGKVGGAMAGYTEVAYDVIQTGVDRAGNTYQYPMTVHKFVRDKDMPMFLYDITQDIQARGAAVDKADWDRLAQVLETTPQYQKYLQSRPKSLGKEESAAAVQQYYRLLNSSLPNESEIKEVGAGAWLRMSMANSKRYLRNQVELSLMKNSPKANELKPDEIALLQLIESDPTETPTLTEGQTAKYYDLLTKRSEALLGDGAELTTAETAELEQLHVMKYAERKAAIEKARLEGTLYQGAEGDPVPTQRSGESKEDFDARLERWKDQHSSSPNLVEAEGSERTPDVPRLAAQPATAARASQEQKYNEGMRTVTVDIPYPERAAGEEADSYNARLNEWYSKPQQQQVQVLNLNEPVSYRASKAEEKPLKYEAPKPSASAPAPKHAADVKKTAEAIEKSNVAYGITPEDRKPPATTPGKSFSESIGAKKATDTDKMYSNLNTRQSALVDKGVRNFLDPRSNKKIAPQALQETMKNAFTSHLGKEKAEAVMRVVDAAFTARNKVESSQLRGETDKERSIRTNKIRKEIMLDVWEDLTDKLQIRSHTQNKPPVAKPAKTNRVAYRAVESDSAFNKMMSDID